MPGKISSCARSISQSFSEKTINDYVNVNKIYSVKVAWMHLHQQNLNALCLTIPSLR